jgi:NAD(P)-dependent dehydrogenase (short-subunit alcohol dehydrogenase family)
MARVARSLSGKVVVITGAGRGIGAATAEALVAKGAKVVLGDLDLGAAEETAARLDKEPVPMHVDVTDPVGLAAFLAEVESTVGAIDVLINNAGIMPLAAVDEETDASTVRQLEVNLLAVIRATREAVRRMKPRRAGHILNVASVAGKSGYPGGSTYCATKHGVVGFSEAVRLELRGSGIDVSCVMPAIVRTELAAGLGEARFIKSIQPRDVAEAIVNALEFPHFDVYVPKSVGGTAKIMGLLPRKWSEAVVRALKADQILNVGHSPERAAYENRAATASGSGRSIGD